MPVPIDPPITVDAVPEKTYALWFFTNFKTENLHDPVNATITFDKVPFDGVNDYLWSHKEAITRPFWDVVANVSGAAAVMNSVIAVLPSIEAYDPA